MWPRLTAMRESPGAVPYCRPTLAWRLTAGYYKG